MVEKIDYLEDQLLQYVPDATSLQIDLSQHTEDEVFWTFLITANYPDRPSQLKALRAVHGDDARIATVEEQSKEKVDEMLSTIKRFNSMADQTVHRRGRKIKENEQ